MNSREAIQLNLDMANMVATMYLADLEDKDLLVRPTPDCNHIAWQLGHLIRAEHDLVNQVLPGSMPALPQGFAEQHSPENSKLDAANAFLTKSQYLDVAKQQRAATLTALHKLSDSDLDRPAPEKMRDYCKNVGDLFSLQGSHWMMHAGQWAVIRRKLGKQPLF